MFPDQLSEVVSRGMRRNLLKSPDIRLLTSTSCGDIFRFRTARLARSHVRTNLAA
jgi:hypothetical protein